MRRKEFVVRLVLPCVMVLPRSVGAARWNRVCVANISQSYRSAPMANKPIKHEYGVVHGLAECSDCDWKTESYKNAQASAANHARFYGHRVVGELGISFSYDGRASREVS